MKQFSTLLIPFILFSLVGCGGVPDTGRKQVHLLSPLEEAQRGAAEFNQLKSQLPISRNLAYNAQLQLVGQRLAKVIQLPEAQWEFVVFENPSPNAFALPGGKVGVFSGLFEVTRTEAGLAAVIGHEVAHVKARHSGERLSRGILTASAVAAGAYLLNKNTGIPAETAASRLGDAGARSYQAHSREQELEADKLGSLYMARAGYNPKESILLWQRFEIYRRNNGYTQLATHPLDSERIQQLEAYMPRAMQEFRPL